MKLTKVALSGLAIALMTVLPLAAVAQSTEDAQQPEQTAPAQQSEQTAPLQQSERQPGQFGGRHHHGEWRGQSGPFKEFQESLSPDQKQQMAAIRQQSRSEIAPLREQFRSIREQLSADPKPANADELQTKLESLKEQMHSQMETNHQKMMAILTDAQKAQLEKIRAQHRDGDRD